MVFTNWLLETGEVQTTEGGQVTIGSNKDATRHLVMQCSEPQRFDPFHGKITAYMAYSQMESSEARS